MSPEDFKQFDDPRVREVMAAAANLVEDLSRRAVLDPALARAIVNLGSALFAAQHSKPKTNPRPPATPPRALPPPRREP